MGRNLKYLHRNGIFIVLPFFLYFFAMVFFPKESGSNYVFLLGFLFYIYLLISIVYFLTFKIEKIVKYSISDDTKPILMAHVFMVIIFLTLAFASFYWCIYDYNHNSFKNVIGQNFFEQYFDFFYYSLGIFLVNNNSEIQAVSNYSKLFSLTEMLSTFISIILIFSNYKDFKL